MNETVAPPVIKKMPVFPDTHRASIDEFLSFLRDRIEQPERSPRVGNARQERPHHGHGPLLPQPAFHVKLGDRAKRHAPEREPWQG